MSRVRILGRSLFQQSGIAHYDGKQIIEIMGDAAGKLTDGVHLLGLPELSFQLFALGEIARGGQQETVALVMRRLEPERISRR